VRRLRALAALAGAALAACAGPAPIVETQSYATASGLFQRVAVAPFYPSRQLTGQPEGLSAGDVAELVARFATEAFQDRGIDVVAPNDLLVAFEGAGLVVPRGEPGPLAELAAEKFGATSVLLGEVTRYQERQGQALGTFHPASVAFTLELYTAPGGVRVWSARFDETQVSLSANVMRARQYPGGGTRWLTAAELARWGIDRAIDSVPKGLR
jgi:hypothetical protein